MTTRDQHRAAAALRHDLDRSVIAILRRGGDPEAVALAIHAAYTGRYDLRALPTLGQKCPIHPGTALVNGVCPICGPQGT